MNNNIDVLNKKNNNNNNNNNNTNNNNNSNNIYDVEILNLYKQKDILEI
jgi:hypothetical protein